MSERVDQRIRSAVRELVESASPPHPYLQVAARTRRPGRQIGTKWGLVVMVSAAAVVLFVGLIGVWIGRNLLPGEPVEPAVTSPPATAAIRPEGTVAVPDDHLAARLLADGAGYDQFSAEAVMCARGGSGAGPYTTCLVDDQGLVVVVPLRLASGVDASITGSALDAPTVVPLPAVPSEDSPPPPDQLFAVPHGDGNVRVELIYNGESAGAVLSGGLSSAGAMESGELREGAVRIPEGHAVYRVMAEEPTYHQVPDLAAETGVEFSCGRAGQASSCVIWESGVAVVVPFSIPKDSAAGPAVPHWTGGSNSTSDPRSPSGYHTNPGCCPFTMGRTAQQSEATAPIFRADPPHRSLRPTGGSGQEPVAARSSRYEAITIGRLIQTARRLEDGLR